jgi:hypothetical protein
MLARPGTVVEVIHGETPSDERLRIRQRFGSDDPQRIVLVAQVRTMSLAVNELVTASHAVYGSLSQLRDDFIQSRDRLNRTGQVRPVTFWYALAGKPGRDPMNGAGKLVDGVILTSHFARSKLEADMLDYVKNSEV